MDKRPIEARPVGRLERCWKWVRRNPAWAATLFLFTSVVLSALGTITLLYRHAVEREKEAIQARGVADEQLKYAQAAANKEKEERQRADVAAKLAKERQKQAEQSKEQADAVADFLTKIMEAADPLGISGSVGVIPRGTGEELKARDILNRGAEQLKTNNRLSTITKAKLQDYIGHSLLSLTQINDAEPLLVEAYQQRLKLLPAGDPDIAISLQHLGWLRQLQGRYTQAESHYKEAIALVQTHPARDEKLLTALEFNLGLLWTETEDYEQAEPILQRVLQKRLQLFGDSHREVALAYMGLTALLLDSGREMETIPFLVKVAEIARTQKEIGNLMDAVSLFQQAVVATMVTRDYLQAEKLLRQAQAIFYTHLGKSHIYTVFPDFQLGFTLYLQNRFSESEELFADLWRRIRSWKLTSHPKALLFIRNYGLALKAQNKDPEVLQLYENWLRELDPQTRQYTNGLAAFGEILGEFQHEERQREVLEHAYRRFEQEDPPPKRFIYIDSLRSLVWNYLRNNKAKQALPVTEKLLSVTTKHYKKRPLEIALSQAQNAHARIYLNESGPEIEELLQKAKELAKPKNLFASVPSYELFYISINQARLYSLRNDLKLVRTALQDAQRYANSPMNRIDLADWYASLISKATSENERQELTQLSLQWVKKGVDTGFRNAKRLENKVFDPLRGLEEFQKLLLKLEKPVLNPSK